MLQAVLYLAIMFGNAMLVWHLWDLSGQILTKESLVQTNHLDGFFASKTDLQMHLMVLSFVGAMVLLWSPAVWAGTRLAMCATEQITRHAARKKS